MAEACLGHTVWVAKHCIFFASRYLVPFWISCGGRIFGVVGVSLGRATRVGVQACGPQGFSDTELLMDFRIGSSRAERPGIATSA